MATGVDAARDLRGSRQRVQHALAAAIETAKGLDDESVGAEFSAALDPLLDADPAFAAPAGRPADRLRDHVRRFVTAVGSGHAAVPPVVADGRPDARRRPTATAQGPRSPGVQGGTVARRLLG